MYIDDTDPKWEERSGGGGHWDYPDWSADDQDRARVYYEALSPKAQEIFDYIRATPGRLISCYEIAERFDLNPDGTKGTPHVVAGHFHAITRPREESGRRLPFCWWDTRYGADYAVKQSVADVFKAAVGQPL